MIVWGVLRFNIHRDRFATADRHRGLLQIGCARFAPYTARMFLQMHDPRHHPESAAAGAFMAAASAVKGDSWARAGATTTPAGLVGESPFTLDTACLRDELDHRPAA